MLTFDVPGQVQADPGKAPLSFQGNFFWLQVSHSDLESPAEASRHSRQVRDFENFPRARSNVTLQSAGEEGGNAPKRLWWRDGSDDRHAAKRRHVLQAQKGSDNMAFWPSSVPKLTSPAPGCTVSFRGLLRLHSHSTACPLLSVSTALLLTRCALCQPEPS